ncbi:MAG TPA: hypothetical protein VKT25_13420, partial [Ktedonobacteraceae bacterium]|nr:hypothetical protein [Ktedonobacteraceae bacterium]
MSSHREAPSSTILSALSGVPNLAEVHLQAGGMLALNELLQPHVSTADADTWHTNLNITDLYAFQKPDDPRKTILVMNVNPMPPKLADAFDSTAV